MGRTLVTNHSHWGAFSAVVEDGRVIGTKPFALDPDPSPLMSRVARDVLQDLRIVGKLGLRESHHTATFRSTADSQLDVATYTQRPAEPFFGLLFAWTIDH